MKAHNVGNLLLQIVLLSRTGQNQGANDAEVHSVSVCFGNLDIPLTTLKLTCQGSGQTIQVMSVTHGAKLLSTGCPSPASMENYDPTCCQVSSQDCLIDYPVDIMAPCNGLSVCDDIRSIWSNTQGVCEDGRYPVGTNYMQVEYICVDTAAETTKEIQTTVLTSPSTMPTTTSTRVFPTDKTSSRNTDQMTSLSTKGQTSTKPTGGTTEGSTSDDEELSSGMISAIIGASIGMVLIIIIFAFYTGRRRHIRIEGKPPPSVWDYLLPTAFTVRGERGYDHFPNRRSVNSTTSSEGSSIGGSGTSWQPNIAPGSEPPEDDNASVYDNNENNGNLSIAPQGSSNQESSSQDTRTSSNSRPVLNLSVSNNIDQSTQDV